ncbi:hypothetical protein [Mammaliicoccus sciuri]|uniref:hypothetical protein n=1 Tax=Mammaliicoccus sciuri TaxID=1296 RepID=UPI002B259219|nr:hypothetical protein [Mammaliicoccus sciuri]WQK62722.1 hypothetical protein P3U20_11000 [Mammaliicoccus sciuri]
MERLIYELKYVGFNFLILILGYIFLFKPASDLRKEFQSKYGEGIKASNIFNSEYIEQGKEHTYLFLYAIAIYILVIIIAAAMIHFVDHFIFAYLQIVIALILIIISLFGMINAYIATFIVGAFIIILIGYAVLSSSNSR